MLKAKGFTLVELLVVMAIVAVLATIAAPSFKKTILSTVVSSSVNTFLSDVRYSRSEALKRGGSVVMCRSLNPEASSPTCSTSDPSVIGWASGWIVFHDRDSSGDQNIGDIVLRVQAPMTSVVSIMDGTTSPTYKLSYTETGRLKNLSGASSLQFGSNPPFTNDLQRKVCISLGGRARIAGSGTVSCS